MSRRPQPSLSLPVARHRPRTVPRPALVPVTGALTPEPSYRGSVDVDAAALVAHQTDQLAQALLAGWTHGVSPVAISLAFSDWLLHLYSSPGKQVELIRKLSRKSLRYGWYLALLMQQHECPTCIEPLPGDRRFRGEAWSRWPFNAMHQAFLMQQQWWHNATTDVHGVSPHHLQVVNFCVRQMLDACAPANFPLTNPEVLDETVRSGSGNLMRGALNLVDDLRRGVLGEPPAGAEAFIPGETVAITPGVVVFRNRLIELIQYLPQTPSVHPEPVLIVSAWIMKYYILDLSPDRSLIRHLVKAGFTVFAISWVNPGPDERDLSMEDYLQMGILDAMAVIEAIVPRARIHATGYCLGGTLLAMAGAALARDRAHKLASITLFAAQVDFEEAGELTLFIDHSQVALMEDMMAAQGFLETRQMAGAFQMLRSNDLIWSRTLRDYLLGRRAPMTDLMAWNADATRMPYRMHSDYLRRLFLGNDLTAGRCQVGGRAVSLGDIDVDLFAVSTHDDHVAPWPSVYKLHLFTESELCFVLASGGHNVGVINPPENGFPSSSFQCASRRRGAHYLDADTWADRAPTQSGSWWPTWVTWLSARSGRLRRPPPVGNPARGFPVLGKAPGTYVHQR